MSIHRITKEKDFVVLDNTMLKDANLSLKAKGLLAFILSRPDDWVFSIRGLAHFSKDGPDSVRSAVRELEKAGYIVRKRKRDRGKYREMEYDIYERPILEKPAQVKPKKEKPLRKKTPIPNTDPPNNELPNIDDTNYPSINPQQIERWIREKTEYDIMCQRYDRRQVDDIVAVMAEAMQCEADTIRVSRNKVYSADYVRSCIRKIGPMHIEQIMESLITNQPEIRNIRGYLLAALINAANTMEIGSQYGEAYVL